MKPYPSMALLEYADIATGVYIADRIVKRAPIGGLRHGTVSGGHYLVVFTGSTASVAESWDEAHRHTGDLLLDAAHLPDVHGDLADSILHGTRRPAGDGALAVFESSTIAGLADAAEKSLKGTDVLLVEIRLGDPSLKGKSVLTYHGELNEIEEAARVSAAVIETRGGAHHHRILTAPHPSLTDTVNQSTDFHGARELDLEGESV